MPKEYVPNLLIEDSKHYTSYYHITSEEDRNKVYFQIIEENLPYLSWMENSKVSSYTQKPTYTLEDINLLPNSMKVEKERMLKVITEYNKQEIICNEHRLLYKNAKQIIEKQEIDKIMSVREILDFTDIRIGTESYCKI